MTYTDTHTHTHTKAEYVLLSLGFWDSQVACFGQQNEYRSDNVSDMSPDFLMTHVFHLPF